MKTAPWTKDEDRLLRSLSGGRSQVPAIARTLDRSKRAVRERARRLGINLYRVWTLEDDAYIVSAVRRKIPQRQIAEHLERDERTIRRRIGQLGLKNQAMSLRVKAVYDADLPPVRGSDEEYVFRCLQAGGFGVLNTAAFRRVA